MAEVTDNAEKERYELAVEGEGEPAFAAYTHDGRTLVFVHTSVPPAERGHGVGGRLVAGALADVRRRGMTVIASCPFVADYIDAHPEWRDLLLG